MGWRRAAGWVLLGGVLGMAACSKGAPPLPPPSSHEDGGADGGGDTDAGIEEGNVLLEMGDWDDLERLAVCRPTVDPGVACGSPDFFLAPLCNVRSLGDVAGPALYSVRINWDLLEPVGLVDSLRVVTDGGASTLGTMALPAQELGPERFYLSAREGLEDGGSSTLSLSGCESYARGRRLVGCYARCANGAPVRLGTFAAERLVRREGEAESSGMALLSESPVGRGDAMGLVVSQAHAFVVSGPDLMRGVPGGLTVLDVHDRAAPVLRARIDAPMGDTWRAVAARGDVLYVASSAEGVIAFDISTAAQPQRLSSFPTGVGPVDALSVWVRDARLYVTQARPSAQTSLYDVSQPRAPVRLNGLQSGGADPRVPEHQPASVFSFEGRLYVSHGREGLRIHDEAGASPLDELGHYTYPGATSHAVRVGRFGSRVIAFEGGQDWAAHLRVLDVTNPAQVSLVGEYRLRTPVSIGALELRGTTLFVAHHQDGVRVLDVSEPERPRERAWFNSFAAEHPGAGHGFVDGLVAVSAPGDGYLYTVDTARGLLIFREP
ncbi:hypothetical protein KRR26_31605 [Corallococcus sp. M34]|uniref:LVIVD repeat-containing protein n=1 Tax=Citreicoccus inhibens TaxID=2849499 RepID=UPI0013156F33|nr:hypothetical protein [Citreicoccus inhibens]MBU8900162.1 hypothetical protein [Citreicoccus inhibens]